MGPRHNHVKILNTTELCTEKCLRWYILLRDFWFLYHKSKFKTIFWKFTLLSRMLQPTLQSITPEIIHNPIPPKQPGAICRQTHYNRSHQPALSFTCFWLTTHQENKGPLDSFLKLWQLRKGGCAWKESWCKMKIWDSRISSQRSFQFRDMKPQHPQALSLPHRPGKVFQGKHLCLI